MALFRRFKGSTPSTPPSPSPPAGGSSAAPPPAARAATQTVRATLYTGGETLEVVGESRYQEALCRIAGAPAQGTRVAKRAVLVPEPDNPYDSNAIQVQIDGHLVGYLSREDAARYLPGLRALMEGGSYVALDAMVVCGGPGGVFGVFLDHDPADFGLSRSAPQRRTEGGEMRTGLTEAWTSDIDDDSYDLSWYDGLPPGDRDAVAALRSLLLHDPDPIDRHFQFAELESRLYRLRDIEASALDDFDEVCRQHDAEMEVICAAFRGKWGKIPLLETYKQMAIRQAKAKDWTASLWWIDRGLSLYGNYAARADSVEDLERRRVRALAKLQAPAKPKRAVAIAVFAAPVGREAHPLPPPGVVELETLTCVTCSDTFERPRVRGRKPTQCPSCRATV